MLTRSLNWMTQNKKIWLLFVFLIGTLSLSAQKKSDKLKQQERDLKKKIENTKNLIKNSRNTQQLTIAELAIINHQIAYREELVSNINYQMRKLDEQLEDKQKQILSLENNLKELKDEYAKMIEYAYKNRNADYQFMYIFSANSYNEAYHRMKYIQQYAEYRQRQVERIKETKITLQGIMEELEVKKVEKKDLAKVQELEKANFLADKELQRQALNSLKADEMKLKNQLDRQEKKRNEIANAVRKAIEKEIAEAAKKNNSSSGGFKVAPEAAALSKSFTSNKGKLPWPVVKGEITGRYGKHRTGIGETEIDNKGIDITTSLGAEMRASFSGKVTSIIVIPGAGKVVMISHGSYRTVYANLQDVYVSKGDQVSTKQAIGKLLPGESGKNSEAHFEIWKISSSSMGTENPSLWIYR